MNAVNMNKIFLVILAGCFLIPSYYCAQQKTELKIGADRLIEEYLSVIDGNNIGLIVNHTSLLSNGTHLVDALFNIDGIKIISLFSPEHGIRGDADAGSHIADGFDAATNIKITSLYGNTKKPTQEMLDNIDILVFDIQDIGARFYTYISTLYYVIEAAAEYDKQVIILDRPNPIGGNKVDGPILDLSFRSFVGIAEIPIQHGMTVGELALLFNDDIKTKKNISAEVEIIKMLNWDRKKYYDEYFSDWMPPSPNINKFETALVYPGTCLIEGTNISEGRGTQEPFLIIGAPFIESENLIDELMNLSVAGIEYESTTFTPVKIEGMSSSPKLKDITCNGIRISVVNRQEFNAVEFGVHLLSVLIKLYPDKIKFNNDFFDKLAGTDKIRKLLLESTNPSVIIQSWQDDLTNFINKRNKYLLY